jgi:amino acid permease
MYYLVSSLIIAIATGMVALQMAGTLATDRAVYFITIPILVWGVLAGISFYIKDHSGRDNHKPNHRSPTAK